MGIKEDVNEFCETMRNELENNTLSLDIQRESIDERLEFLHDNLLSLINEHSIDKFIMGQILANLLSAYSIFKKGINYTNKIGAEFQQRQKEALEGICALRKLEAPYFCDDEEPISSLYQWTDEERVQVSKLEEKVKAKYHDNFALSTYYRELKCGGEKVRKRRYLTEKEAPICSILRLQSVSYQKAYEIVANLFYGIGLEKDAPSKMAYEIQKNVVKICKKLESDYISRLLLSGELPSDLDS